MRPPTEQELEEMKNLPSKKAKLLYLIKKYKEFIMAAPVPAHVQESMDILGGARCTKLATDATCDCLIKIIEELLPEQDGISMPDYSCYRDIPEHGDPMPDKTLDSMLVDIDGPLHMIHFMQYAIMRKSGATMMMAIKGPSKDDKGFDPEIASVVVRGKAAVEGLKQFVEANSDGNGVFIDQKGNQTPIAKPDKYGVN